MALMNTDLDDPAARTAQAPSRALAVFLVVGGLIGLAASMELTLDKLKLLKNPDYVPPCDISAIVSCTNVMKSDQAGLFGFPNPLLGLVGFAIIITLGVVLLGGAHLAEWVWAGLQIGTLISVVFVHWLAFQTLYQIGALCPYCMVVWSMTIPMFVYVSLHNLRAWRADSAATRFVGNWHALIVALWFLLLAAAIFFRFFV